MPTAVQLLLDRHGAKAPRDDGSELPAGFGISPALTQASNFGLVSVTQPGWSSIIGAVEAHRNN